MSDMIDPSYKINNMEGAELNELVKRLIFVNLEDAPPDFNPAGNYVQAMLLMQGVLTEGYYVQLIGGKDWYVCGWDTVPEFDKFWRVWNSRGQTPMLAICRSVAMMKVNVAKRNVYLNSVVKKNLPFIESGDGGLLLLD